MNNKKEVIKANQYRCEQCTERHRKCDKLIPSCSRCIRRNISCTYPKKGRTDKDLLFIEERLSKLSQINNRIKKGKQKEVTNNQLIIQDRKFKINKLPKGYNKPYTPLGIFHIFPRKDMFINIMTLLQFPSPFKTNMGLSLFLGLVDKLGLLIKRTASNEPLVSVPKPNIPNLKPILDKAIYNYFAYVNSMFPLFIRNGFEFHSKSGILKKAIILSGINYMAQDKLTKAIKDYLYYKLKKLFIIPYKIQPNLESIQAMIILISTIFLVPLPPRLLENYFCFCQKAADLIGLHLQNAKFNRRQRIERDMTYSSIMLIYHFWRLSIGSIISLPYKPIALNNEFKLMIAKIINKDLKRKKLLNSEVYYYFNLTISSFNIELSSILYSVYLLKEKHISVDVTYDGLSIQTNNLIERVQRLKQFYTLIFSQIPKEIIRDEFVCLTNYNNYVLSIYYYLRFYIYSLKFYSPNQGPYQVSVIEYLNDNEYIRKTIKECQLAVEYTIKIPFQWTNRFTLSNLGQCLTFLLRHKYESKLDIKQVINKGLQHLKEIDKIENTCNLAHINLSLLDIVEKKAKMITKEDLKN